LFAAYTAAILNQIDGLASRKHVNLQGALTWSFEFENQPYFAGFRELATNGIDKPVLNTFRMLGLLSGRRLAVNSGGAVPSDEMLKTGVRSRPDVNAIATRQERGITILAWNYHDDDVPAPDAPVDLAVTGIPPAVKQVLIEHFRVDGSHSNAYAEWQRLGSPTHPSADEYWRLEDSGQLQQLTSPQWRKVTEGQITFELALPRQALSLLRITW
jgi:xylan 1,4-beta-xylosidase